MSTRFRWRARVLAVLAFALCQSATADPGVTGQVFIAAILRVRQHQPDLPDSPALAGYAIYDYLIAARMRRDLPTLDDALDAKIDDFLSTRGNQPVTRSLRHDWLASLADRKRWICSCREASMQLIPP